jgi:hypothetical protein
MKFAVAALLLSCADATRLRQRQEPDTACGKGFDEIAGGSQEYFHTASVELFTHPGRTNDNATYARELQCWFANMMTSKCGGLPSQAATRKPKLTAACKDVKVDWYPVWKMFTEDEVKYFKKEFPSKQYDKEDELLTNSKVEYKEPGEKTIHYKEAMETMKEVDKKELLCMTAFAIDDECVKYSYIRLAKSNDGLTGR